MLETNLLIRKQVRDQLFW